jgi:WD40 repeat protein
MLMLAALFLTSSLVVREQIQSPSEPDESTREPNDIYGDPLPLRVIARLGTVRLRSAYDVDRAAINADATLLVTTRDYRPLEVWDVRTGQLLRALPTVKYKAGPIFEGDDRELYVSEEVAGMAFASDPRLLYVLTRNGVLRSCDVIEGRWSEPLARTENPPAERQLFHPHAYASPDGTHFLFEPRDESHHVEVFAVGKSKPVVLFLDRRLENRKRGEPSLRCHLSSDNKLVAIAQDGVRLEVAWDVTTTKPTTTFIGPNLRLLNADISPDGKSLAAVFTPDRGDSIRWDDPWVLVVWDTATGKERYRVPNWKGYIVGYTRDGTKLICMNNNEVILADAATGQVTGLLKGHDPWHLWNCALSADGKHLVTCGSRDRSVIIWDLATGKPSLDFDAPRGRVSTIAFSPDGKTVFTSTTEERAGYLWDTQTGKRKHRLVTDGQGRPQTAAFTPDGKYVVAGYGHGIISGGNKGFSARLWRVSDGKLIREFGDHTDGVLKVALSPDGKRLATRDGTEGKVRLWELDNGRLLREIDQGPDRNTFLAFPTDEELLGVGWARKGDTQIVNLLSGKTLGSWKAERRVYVRAVSPNGQLLASLEEKNDGSRERLVIRRVATGEKVCELPLTNATYWSAAAFSHDGNTVAVGEHNSENEGIVQLFDTTTGKELRVIRGHRGEICALAFSPDDKRLATGSTDTTVLIWDLTTTP